MGFARGDNKKMALVERRNPRKVALVEKAVTRRSLRRASERLKGCFLRYKKQGQASRDI